MTRRVVTLWLAVVAVAATTLWLAGSAYFAARSEAASQVARLTARETQRTRLAALIAELPAWATRTPTEGLAPRVADTLAASGLPSSLLANLSAQAEAAVAGTGGISTRNGGGGRGPMVMSRKATLTLDAITLPQLGRFLESWREREPDWVVSNVDLSLAGFTGRAASSPPVASPPTSNSNDATGKPYSGELPLRAVITIEALHIESSGGTQ